GMPPNRANVTSLTFCNLSPVGAKLAFCARNGSGATTHRKEKVDDRNKSTSRVAPRLRIHCTLERRNRGNNAVERHDLARWKFEFHRRTIPGIQSGRSNRHA